MHPLAGPVFVGAAAVNATLAVRDPQSYGGFAQWAVGAYKGFILGFFRQHAQAIVLAIATGQLLVALLLAVGGSRLWLGVLGGVTFLLAIAPLGIGSAFPSTLIMAAALYVMYRRLRQGLGRLGGRSRRPTYR